jgi:hypothetical protein
MQPTSAPPNSLPSRWLVLVGSAVIVFHLLAVGFHVLAAMSGPWPSMMGPEPYAPPQFAHSAKAEIGEPYLRALRLTDDFHFPSNRPARYGVYCEVLLKDSVGAEIARARLPDPEANWWTRHRQELLVSALAVDAPVASPGSEVIAAPGQKVPELEMWEPAPDNPRHLRLRSVPMHLVPRERMVVAPTPRAKALAQSYARHLCRVYGAASAEVVRYSKDPIPPLVLSGQDLPPGVLDAIESHLGEFRP